MVYHICNYLCTCCQHRTMTEPTKYMIQNTLLYFRQAVHTEQYCAKF